MTFDEYRKEVGAALKKHPEWRAGQAHFNVLLTWRYDLAGPIRSTLLDPFYSDDRLKLFLRVVQERW